MTAGLNVFIQNLLCVGPKIAAERFTRLGNVRRIASHDFEGGVDAAEAPLTLCAGELGNARLCVWFLAVSRQVLRNSLSLMVLRPLSAVRSSTKGAT